MTIRRWPTLIAAVVVVVALLLIVAARMPGRHDREPAYRVKSASNLKQIGQAILL